MHRYVVGLRQLCEELVLVTSTYTEGHLGHPWNELADTICTDLQVHRAQVIPAMQHGCLAATPMHQLIRGPEHHRGWMFLAATPPYARQAYMVQQNGWVTKEVWSQVPEYKVSSEQLAHQIENYVEPGQTVEPITKPAKTLVFTANVQTFGRPGKKSSYRRRMKARKAHIVCLQEARPRTEGIT